MNSNLAESIGIEEFKNLLESETPILILDVRTPYEVAQLSLTGMATELVAMPLEDIFSKLPELEPFRNIPTVVVCGLGLQSQAAVKILRKRGFCVVQNLEGGLEGLLGTRSITLPLTQTTIPDSSPKSF